MPNKHRTALHYFVRRQYKVGVPTDSSANMGALISEQHRDKVRSFVKLAESEGGVIECGGVEPPEHIPESHKNVKFYWQM